MGSTIMAIVIVFAAVAAVDPGHRQPAAYRAARLAGGDGGQVPAGRPGNGGNGVGADQGGGDQTNPVTTAGPDGGAVAPPFSLPLLDPSQPAGATPPQVPTTVPAAGLPQAPTTATTSTFGTLSTLSTHSPSTTTAPTTTVAAPTTTTAPATTQPPVTQPPATAPPTTQAPAPPTTAAPNLLGGIVCLILFLICPAR